MMTDEALLTDRDKLTLRSYTRRPVSIVKAQRWTPFFNGVSGLLEMETENE